MTGKERLVSQASIYLGYKEKMSNYMLDDKNANAGSNNYTRFARDYFPSLQAQPWCLMFVVAAFIEAFGEEKANKLLCGCRNSAYCPTTVNGFRKAGRWKTKDQTPQVGDVIFFQNTNNGVASHVGIVVDVYGGRVYTIEGNTSATGYNDNGGMVARKNYALTSGYILGYGRPDWTIVDGKKFAPNRTLTRAEAVMFLWRLWGSPEPVEKTSFEDVKSTAYYAKAAAWACENGITAGKGKNLFAPDDYCTRGQFCTFMWSASGSPKESVKDFPFVDVPEHAYYYDAVVWAWKHKIASGTSSNSFAPNAKVTRAQAVMMLWAANGRSKAPTASKFSDVTDKAYYKDAVDWAVAEGITSGVS